MSMLLQSYPGDAWCLLVAKLLIQVTVVILSAWLVARLGARWNAAWRYRIYLVALICVLASPVLSLLVQTSGISLLSLRPFVSTAASAEPVGIPITDAPESSPIEAPAPPQADANLVPLDAEDLGQGPQLENRAARSFPDVFRALAAAALVIWLLGVAVLLARWCYWLRLIAALRRTAQPLDHESLNCETIAEPLRQARRALGTNELPPIVVSADLDRPVMVGLIHPLVILPRHVLRALDGRDLADILVHECAHAICRHQVVGLLQRVAAMLFWPHPLIHLLNRQLARAREEVCDNYVLRHSNAPRYGQTLLKLSQMLNDVSPKPMALGLFFDCPWRLEERVADLLDQRRIAMIRVNRLTTAALTATFLLLTLLMAGTTIVRAEPAADEKTTGSKTATPPVKKSKSQPPSVSAVEKKDMERWRANSWQMALDLDMPSLVPPVVQYAIFDKDPIPAYTAQVKRMRSFIRQRLEKAKDGARKERLRASQMMGLWDLGFREVTGDRLSLLITRPGASPSVDARVSAGVYTPSSEAPISPPPNSLGGKKWVVTKVVRIKGEPVCWCIPVEVKIGGEVKVTLNESNTFDLQATYNDAMREGKEIESK